jgi:2-dehydropantoate 2-reductase
MHFTVIGAGAIGGTVGAYLIRAGYEVLLVDSVVEHVETMARNGLHIEGREDFVVRPRALTPDGLKAALGGRHPDAVLLAVKAQHTAAATQFLLPYLGPASFIVSLQNGLNEKIIAPLAGQRRTVGAFINSFGADYLSPARILYSGPGTVYLGELDGQLTPRVRQLESILQQCFSKNTHVTDNIWGYLWGKEGYGSMLFASATVDETMANVLGDPSNEALLANLAGEVVMAADAEGVRCAGFDGYEPDAMRFTTPRNWTGIRESLDRLAALNRRSLKQKSGIWRDLAVRHRPTEVDAQLGMVVESARAHGLQAPLNSRVVELIHAIETGTRAMDPLNLEELRKLNEAVYPDRQPLA